MRPEREDAAPCGVRHRESKGKGQRTDSTSPRPFTLIAIKPNGVRVVAGRFSTNDEAERNAALLRRLSRLTGGDAVVEHAGGAR